MKKFSYTFSVQLRMIKSIIQTRGELSCPSVLCVRPLARQAQLMALQNNRPGVSPGFEVVS